ncbi:hypothetical protein AB1Y20_017730 [Prymnesium parvum]|uniref:Uncharacterized protein n=1 Tax=Prymnesium parvum TaxID=97485 RepID=A0AB34JPY9_PRYPA
MLQVPLMFVCTCGAERVNLAIFLRLPICTALLSSAPHSHAFLECVFVQSTATLRFPEPLRGRACYLDGLRVAHCVPNNEHIVFMGDSVARYQWLALAQSLHQGEELSASEFPSIVKEREWLGWMQFFTGTTRRMHPNHHCDCYREYAKPVGSKTIENRYFWHMVTNDSGQVVSTLNLTFINVLDKHGQVMGHWAPWSPLSDVRQRTMTKHRFEPGWSLDWVETIEKFVAKLSPPPTVLVLNSGLWGPLSNETFATLLAAAAKQAAPRVLWKTTTRMRNAGVTKWRRTDLLARRTFREIFDAAYLTRSCSAADFWDPRHFLPHVYNRLNAALLWQLYGKPLGCTSFQKGRCTAYAPVNVLAAGGLGSSTSNPGSSQMRDVSDIEQAVRNTTISLHGWEGVKQALSPLQWDSLQTVLWLDSINPAIKFDHKAVVGDSIAADGVNGSLLLAILRGAPFAPPPTSIGIRRTLHVHRLRTLLEQLIHKQTR